jgi:signal transduction histidine kinase
LTDTVVNARQDGRLYARIWFFRDSRTQRARAEVRQKRSENANRAEERFSLRMSHELRTPLNAILGSGNCSNAERRDQRGITHIVTAGQHLLNLINEVWIISRIELGGWNFRWSQSAWPMLCRRARPHAPARG